MLSYGNSSQIWLIRLADFIPLGVMCFLSGSEMAKRSRSDGITNYSGFILPKSRKMVDWLSIDILLDELMAKLFGFLKNT